MIILSEAHEKIIGVTVSVAQSIEAPQAAIFVGSVHEVFGALKPESQTGAFESVVVNAVPVKVQVFEFVMETSAASKSEL